MKRITALAVAAALCLSLCACGAGDGSSNSSTASGTASATAEYKLPNPKTPTSRTDDEAGFQLDAPEIGEKVVVLETSMGEIVMRLFPESAPKAVENFVGLVESGYYNGITFHRVINDFMIQGGDPTATGSGGESIWGEDFEDEFNANLLNLRGSVAMANSGVNTNGSQFFINQTSSLAVSKNSIDLGSLFRQNVEDAQTVSYLTELYNSDASAKQEYATVDEFISNYVYEFLADQMLDPRTVPDEVWALYEKYGGNIALDGAWKANKGHTVFAQVITGMNVVDSIAEVETDSNDKPTTDVVIVKAYTTEFTEEMLDNIDVTI